MKLNKLAGIGAILALSLCSPNHTFAQSSDKARLIGPYGDFADVVEQVKPGVVLITAKTNSTIVPEDMLPVPSPRGMQPRKRSGEARGSGFIVDPIGIIVTNAHVVSNSHAVTVTLEDGAEIPAVVVGRDERTDIAVLKINAGHMLHAVELGNSDAVRVGQWVIAVGNPFGLGVTVTAGIVSARGRNIGAGPYDDFVQIDAPINPGNSGGPVFTQDGKVLGMNTAIFSPTGGSVGIGFAIPSNVIKNIIEQLERDGKIDRGFLGVTTQNIQPELAGALGLKGTAGAIVIAIEPNSPAAKVHLQPGDVIEMVNETKVSTPRELAIAIGALKPGDSATLHYTRDGEARTATVNLATLGDKETNKMPEKTPPSAKVGMSLTDIPEEVKGIKGIPSDIKGVLVGAVRPGSPADNAGIEAGDILLNVGRRPVETAEDAVKAIHEDAQKGTLALRMMRNGKISFIVVNLKEEDQ